MVWLAIPPDEEADGIEGGDGPDPKPHRKVSPAVAIDTSEWRLGVVVGAGQILHGRRQEAVELLLVDVAGNAKAIVVLLLSESA